MFVGLFLDSHIELGDPGDHPGGSSTHSEGETHPNMHFSKYRVFRLWNHFLDGNKYADSAFGNALFLSQVPYYMKPTLAGVGHAWFQCFPGPKIRNTFTTFIIQILFFTN